MKNIKAFIKQDFRIFLIAIGIPFLVLSCSSDNNKPTTEQTNPAALPLTDKFPNQKYEIVPNEKVCMVNDRFMGIKQIPIEVEGITYYGCCENCVKKIQENLSGVRYSKDPVSGEKVDKASAVIIKNNEDGMVQYFGSEATVNEFMKQ